jgi:hypothetical protein
VGLGGAHCANLTPECTPSRTRSSDHLRALELTVAHTLPPNQSPPSTRFSHATANLCRAARVRVGHAFRFNRRFCTTSRCCSGNGLFTTQTTPFRDFALRFRQLSSLMPSSVARQHYRSLHLLLFLPPITLLQLQAFNHQKSLL